jgi:hypothetical protein
MHKLFKKITNIFKRVARWHWAVYLAIFLASGSISVVALRHNNQTMIKLRDAVYTADKNNGNIEGALDNLRAYVYGHMNTDLSSGGNGIKPPIQLKYTYERLQASAQAQTDTANSKVYTDAQSYCQAQNPTDFSGRNRVPCVQNYVSTHGVQPSSVPTALYEYDFISPSWSPDLAGWSLLIAGASFITFVASFVINRIVKVKIKAQQI